METYLSYRDVCLIPSYSECRSRDHLDAGIEFLGRKFKCAAIPANMKTTIDFKLAEWMSENDYFYILHRFYDYDSELYPWIKSHQHLKNISISVGVNEKDRHFINMIAAHKLNVHFITIDIASGHNVLAKEMIEYIKRVFERTYPNIHLLRPKIIAGNVMTREATDNLMNWGADAVKVGLSMGAACTTFNATGVGSPMVSTIRNCCGFNTPIIADSQIREVGDVCKALVLGATFAMVGSLFAACENSPAELVEDKYYLGRDFNPSQKKYKKYFGSASATNKGHDKYIEGHNEILLECNDMSYARFLNKVNDGVRSCMSYAGVNSPKELTKMKWAQRLDFI